MANGSADERRRWARVPVHGEVLGRIFTEAAAPILDLSEGGALLDVPCVLRPRSLYTLKLALEGGQVLSLKASVVRSHAHGLETMAGGETRVRYRAAVQFVGITDEDRAFLKGRIDREPAEVDGPEERSEGVVGTARVEAHLDGQTHAETAPNDGARPSEGSAATDAAGSRAAAAAEPPQMEMAPGPAADERLGKAALEASHGGPAAGADREADYAKSQIDLPDEPGPSRGPAAGHSSPASASRSGLWSRLRNWLFGLPEPRRGGAEPTTKDRRDSERLPLEGAVRGKMSLHLESEILLLSKGGMQVRLPYSPVKGSVMSFTIGLGAHPVRLRGSVRNSQQTSDPNGHPLYDVGVEFLDMADSVRRELSDYVERRGAPSDR